MSSLLLLLTWLIKIIILALGAGGLTLAITKFYYTELLVGWLQASRRLTFVSKLLSCNFCLLHWAALALLLLWLNTGWGMWVSLYFAICAVCSLFIKTHEKS